MKEILLTVRGKVQGVFFRATAKEIAEDMQVKGYAKNMSDQSVEIVAQGSENNLEKFVKRIQENPGNAIISNLEKTYRSPEKTFKQFTIY